MLRKALILCGLPCLGAVILVVGYYCVSRPRVTPENFERIQKGMSEAEVIALIGESKFHHKTRVHGKPETTKDVKQWTENRGVRIIVWFDLDGVLIEKFIQDEAIEEDSFVAKIRQWLGL